jgi:hypothetical protein
MVIISIKYSLEGLIHPNNKLKNTTNTEVWQQVNHSQQDQEQTEREQHSLHEHSSMEERAHLRSVLTIAFTFSFLRSV